MEGEGVPRPLKLNFSRFRVGIKIKKPAHEFVIDGYLPWLIYINIIRTGIRELYHTLLI